jgi:low temperature requirement protein LtrA
MDHRIIITSGCASSTTEEEAMKTPLELDGVHGNGDCNVEQAGNSRPLPMLDQPTDYQLHTDKPDGAGPRSAMGIRAPSTKRMSIMSRGPIDDDEDDFRVTSLELFSDLVVVVAIHIASECLEEENWLSSLPWYFINVFQLWLVWHVAMIGFHVSHLFQDHDSILHYVVVVMFMILTLVMAGAQAAGRPSAGLIDYMILRVFEVGVLWLQVLFGEILPLSLSLYLSPDAGKTPYLPLVYLSFFLVIAQRTYGAYKGDQIQQQSRSEGDETITYIFDPTLLKERYELVAIIFIGEIAFGATAGLQAGEFTFILLAVSAVLSAFGSYLLCFGAQPPTSQSFWESSGLRVITGQHFYAGLFSVIPGIAAGYLLIGGTIVERADGNEQGSCDLESSVLLCWSVAAFLTFSGLIRFMNSSPKDKKSHIIRDEVRCGVWLLVVLVAVSMTFLNSERWMCWGSIPAAVFVCPFLLIICACVELWGSLHRKQSVSNAVLGITTTFSRSEGSLA